MSKRTYPGGFRLTLATAKRLAMQEFGTANGLGPDRSTCQDGYFRMEMGNLFVSIYPDPGMSGCIKLAVSMCTAGYQIIGFFNRETLEPDFPMLTKYGIQEKREMLMNWVGADGPDACHKIIDEVWAKGQ